MHIAFRGGNLAKHSLIGVLVADGDARHGDDHGLAVEVEAFDFLRNGLRAGADVVFPVGEEEHQRQWMLSSLRMLLEGLHVGFQPHQGKLQRGGDIGLSAPTVDGDAVRVDSADGGHGAEEVERRPHGRSESRAT